MKILTSYFFHLFRDVDYFIEQLEKTIQFFSGISAEGSAGSDDEFVPFI
jgi:hypothetical protein